MATICSLLKKAIDDEIVAQKYYNGMKRRFSKVDKLKIFKIQDEEHIHEKEFKEIG